MSSAERTISAASSSSRAFLKAATRSSSVFLASSETSTLGIGIGAVPVYSLSLPI